MSEPVRHLDDALSAYLDDELDAAERRRADAHLAVCDDCAALLDSLRDVRVAARRLEDRPPEADLWPGIAARLAAPRSRVLRLPVAIGRTFLVSIPQLAAAAVVVAALSGGLVWWLMAGGTRMGATTSPVAARVSAPTNGRRATNRGTATGGDAGGAMNGGAGGGVVNGGGGGALENGGASGVLPNGGAGGTVAAAADFDSRQYDRAVADLQDVFQRNRSRLDPKTVQQVEANLAVIDVAIVQARRALEADPANAYLNGHLADQLKRKVRVLQQTADAVTADYTGS